MKAGDYVIRGDQPYRTIADMYFSVQNYAPANPRPYDDTGWTFQYMRNLVIKPLTDKRALDQPMALLTTDAKAPGRIEGSGPVLIVEHTTDSNLVTFRFRNATVRMQAAEEDFEAAGHRFRAGAFIVSNADRRALEPMIRDLGLSAWAVATVPPVQAHDLDVARIGYVHSWARTQDEGWVRAAFDTYGVPYTYFGDATLREGHLRAKYDVIVFPHVGGTAASQVNGIPKTGTMPLPYRKSAEFPSLGANDQADDIRGGMGIEGLMELVKFVQEGGTLITEGSTSAILPEYHITTGITREPAAVVRARVDPARRVRRHAQSARVWLPGLADSRLLQSGSGAERQRGRRVRRRRRPDSRRGYERDADGHGLAAAHLPVRSGSAGPAVGGTGRAGLGAGRRTRGRSGSFAAAAEVGPAPRIVLQFPSNAADMLLSGTLSGGQALANRAQLVDVPLGQGHVVAFAIRPFWRWQTQGTYCLAFNAILNWNDLDAGRPAPAASRGAPAAAMNSGGARGCE